jgi:hypothetical protein
VQVSALEAIVGKGGRVVEADVVALTEALMTELVKLDAIAAEGEVKAQRRMQVSLCTHTHGQYKLNLLAETVDDHH